MKDLKKLFLKDKKYWIILLTVLILVIITGIGSCESFFSKELQDLAEWKKSIAQFRVKHPDRELSDEVYCSFGHAGFWYMLQMLVLVLTLLVHGARVLVQETQNRTEMRSILPVKGWSVLVYHYLSGILTVFVPLFTVGLWAHLRILQMERTTDVVWIDEGLIWINLGGTCAVFLLHYAILLFCRRVATHVPGTILGFILVELGLINIVYRLGETIPGPVSIDLFVPYMDDKPVPWLWTCVFTLGFIVLSFLAEVKRDLAGNGVFAFSLVHWTMMALVFAEVCNIFGGVFENSSLLLRVAFALVGGILVTAGAHFVTRPRKW